MIHVHRPTEAFTCSSCSCVRSHQVLQVPHIDKDVSRLVGDSVSLCIPSCDTWDTPGQMGGSEAKEKTLNKYGWNIVNKKIITLNKSTSKKHTLDTNREAPQA